MPYASNAELPEQAKPLPDEAKTVFRRVFNQSSADGKKEEVAFAIAWTAVKNGWSKDSEGNWTRKVKKDSNKGLTNDYNCGISGVNLISDIFKSDEEHRVCYGWASVVTKNGEPVIDLHGDLISPNELVGATTEFMKSARNSLNMHKGEPIGQVVHSFPLTYEIAKSLGIETENEGWLVGVYVSCDKTWESVKNGALSAFSIGGSAIRKEIE